MTIVSLGNPASSLAAAKLSMQLQILFKGMSSLFALLIKRLISLEVILLVHAGIALGPLAIIASRFIVNIKLFNNLSK